MVGPRPGLNQIWMMLFQPRVNLKGKTRGMKKKLLRLGVADNIGLLIKKVVPLSATGIEINGFFGERRISRFQG
jgi:hypothetical protein